MNDELKEWIDSQDELDRDKFLKEVVRHFPKNWALLLYSYFSGHTGYLEKGWLLGKIEDVLGLEIASFDLPNRITYLKLIEGIISKSLEVRVFPHEHNGKMYLTPAFLIPSDIKVLIPDKPKSKKRRWFRRKTKTKTESVSKQS